MRSSTAAKVLWRAAVVVFLFGMPASAAVVETKEAYFNGSAYIRLLTPMPIWSHSAISFRTCKDGEILSQRYNQHILLLSVHKDSLSLSLTARGSRVEARVQARLLDNRWHDIHLQYEQGTLQLVVDKQSVVVANSTYHTEFLDDQDIKNEASVLIVGQNYYGCLLHGPGLIFNSSNMNAEHVQFGPCPLATGPCGDHGDLLLRPSIDYCKNDPCMQHGSCISRGDSYVCHCTARYSGKNCEIDSGSPCNARVCENNGVCEEDRRGDYKCICPTGFSGPHCEEVIYAHPLCASNPCKNNGVCRGVAGSNRIECDCYATGFTGQFCEIDKDDCASSPCENGGRCIDGKGSFECDCSDTGYRGTTCQENIDECLERNPCQNGASCYDTYGSFTCECAPGYGGYNCGKTINGCIPQPCQHGGTCIDHRGSFECLCLQRYSGSFCQNDLYATLDQIQFSDRAMGSISEPEKRVDTTGELSGCYSDPCLNGGSCFAKGANEYTCACVPGYDGVNCENDIDDCKGKEKACNFGICVDKVNGYECYCKPGYTGTNCDRDFDECLSMPCKNNGICVNLVNDFSCECPNGYEGKDCSTDIDECASNPCSPGSTCIDEVAQFRCVCIPGMTGPQCETNIDDCAPQPCFNGGRCIDKLNDFECDCAGTGFSGMTCEVNIDECLSQPCQNGAQCIDLVNDYKCNCYPGYTDKNCDIDIDECEKKPCLYNGTCYQKSDRSLYDNYREGVLPSVFASPFSYDNASGYVCKCVDGIIGENCETNIDECESSPCLYGTCDDMINDYTCNCDPGYEGRHCELDIDECAVYKPCLHGTCHDKPNNYKCECDPAWGGKNCSVKLIGCDRYPCLNGGMCTPKVINETEHKFDCKCPQGFQGLTCEKITTISLLTTSLITVNTTREEGYDIQLRFKTTLPNGILAFGTGTFGTSARYILGLVGGRLNLHSSLLNKWEGVFIGSHLNDSQWQKVFVSINSTHLVLSANDEQTIYPISSYEGTNGSNSTFPVTNLGGTIPNLHSYLRHLTHTPSSFVGCMEDVVINGEWVFPEEPNNSQITLHDVPEGGCPRVEQCDPNPCNSNGQCTDLWHTFSCTCQRPFLGKTCKFEITAATFGNENTTPAPVTIDVYDQSRRAVRSVLDISMFIRTRKATGHILYLGSENRTSTTRDWGDSFVSSKLVNGELFVQMQLNGSPEAYTVGGNKLDNGYTHLIQIIRNATLIQVKINGTEYFRKTISSTGQLDAQILYLGGPPPSWNTSGDVDFFKGIIQDVKVSNGSQLYVVELYPLNDSGLDLPPSFGEVDIQPNSTLPGEVSDDHCRSSPCLHAATCRNTWNDFVCICPRGYKGKHCEDIQFCEIHKCPGQGVCKNLDDGFECITNTTFQGTEKEPLMFTYVGVSGEKRDLNKEGTLEITYRAKTGGTLLHVQNDQLFFEVASYLDQVSVLWRLSSGLPETRRFAKPNSNYEWNTIHLKVSDNTIEGGWQGWDSPTDSQPLFTAPIDQQAYKELFSGKYPVYLGGPAVDTSAVLLSSGALERDLTGANYRYENTPLGPSNAKGINEGAVLKGCLGEVRIDGFLLPYFTHKEMYNDITIRRSYYMLSSTKPEEGCVLCFQKNCQNGGVCSDPAEKYPCDCVLGYSGDDCSVNIDECLMSECQNDAKCVDGIGNYTCSCVPGFTGRFCELDIDECESEPCLNGGKCNNEINRYTCNCTEEFTGTQCEVLRLVTCENHPCQNGSTCTDGYNADTKNNFTCSCSEGYQGVTCNTAFCNVEKCQNNGICLITESAPPKCHCSGGHTGKFCETEIDYCEERPCQHGECINLKGDYGTGYQCDCSGTGFEGEDCEIDIDECIVSKITCGNRGTCLNTRGSFKCRCEAGKCGMSCNLEDPCSGENVCLNGGVCIETCTTEASYVCNCTQGFTGTNCSDVVVLASDGASPTDIALIVVPVVVGLLLLGAIALGVFLTMARNKRATRGTYSPSAQEYCNPRLEMDNVLKPPPEERLI